MWYSGRPRTPLWSQKGAVSVFAGVNRGVAVPFLGVRSWQRGVDEMKSNKEAKNLQWEPLEFNQNQQKFICIVNNILFVS